MNSEHADPILENVLDLFQLEDDHGSNTLERYVRAYPQFAGKLIDFSRLLTAQEADDEEPLSATDQSRIDAAWIIHSTATPALEPDPFASVSQVQSKALAKKLGAPRQVILGICERKALPDTVPSPVVHCFAEELGVPPAHIIAGLRRPATHALSRSFKADGKPGASGQVSFKQLLIDAGVSEADRARLLADE